MADSWSEIATAVGTLGAVIVATFVAGLDSRRRRRDEQRKQAEMISAWMEELPGAAAILEGAMYKTLVLENASDQLAYNLVASVVNAQTEIHVGDDLKYRTYVGLLRPGRTEYRIEYPGDGMHKRFAVELAFEDTGGRAWLRRGRGGLRRIKQNPLAFYDIDPPVAWLMP